MIGLDVVNVNMVPYLPSDTLEAIGGGSWCIATRERPVLERLRLLQDIARLAGI